MTTSVNIKCNTYDARSLDELNKLIAKRSEILDETTKDAVISTAINVLLSLRSGTKDAKVGRNNIKTRVVEMPGLVASFTSDKRRCLRHRGGSRFDVNRVRYFTRGIPERQLKVFKVIPGHSKVSEYYIVTDTVDSAIKFEQAAATHRIDNYGTLAKWALGVAMNKISTRNVQDGVSSQARLAGSRLSDAKTYGGSGPSGSFYVEVTDNLDYAYPALKHGASELDLAFRKAANKTAGLINHFNHQSGRLKEDVPTPFPEVKRRK